MTCQRCESAMLEFGIMVSGDAVTQKRISAWRCRNCGRMEYGTEVNTSTLAPSASCEGVSIV